MAQMIYRLTYSDGAPYMPETRLTIADSETAAIAGAYSDTFTGRPVSAEAIGDWRPQIAERIPGPFSAGPSKIRGALCEDGRQRTAVCSDRGADTFFSIPARVKVRGRTVTGYITRETIGGYSTETPGDPAVWRFVANRYGANADAILTHSIAELRKPDRTEQVAQASRGR